MNGKANRNSNYIMIPRRSFIRKSALLSSLAGFAHFKLKASPFAINTKPLVISTWEHGIQANEAAWQVLNKSGRAFDAVEEGVKVTESDPNNRSVGYGGLPDITGRLTLDACIMDENQQCGSVACLEHIMNPISVARKVMEETKHVMLVGEGALEFAIQKGFRKQNLITPECLEDWQNIKKRIEEDEPLINIENDNKTIINKDNHDTIGMLAIDSSGNLSGACTTSGAALKLHGRVGDSPIIGAGLFVDNEVGAACATGLGEEVIKQAGSAMVVELMRNGMSPEDACKEITMRIKRVNKEEFQVGFLALRKDGAIGAYSMVPGFNYAVHDGSGNVLKDSPSIQS